MNTDYTLTEEETARVEREVEKERKILTGDTQMHR